MADNKKYYYLKLKEGFFETEELKILQSMPDGYLYSDILLKLYLRSLRNDGRLMYKDIIPYTSSIIATLTGHQVGTVEKAVGILKQFGLIEILDNGAIYMMDIQNLIGQSSTEADRKRDYRKRIDAEKMALSNNSTGQMSGQTDGQKSIDIEDKSTPENRDKSIENRDNRSINTSIARSSGGQNSGPKADVEALLLNDGTEWKPTKTLFAEYVRLYPNVDVKQQFNEMRGWCLSNPEKRKTKRGITRFVNSWLSREQDRGGRKVSPTSGYKQSGSGYSKELLERLAGGGKDG